MAVGLLSPKIQCIVYILIFPWLLTYGLGQFTCSKEETMKILWCGKSRLSHKCNTVTCVQRDAQSIKRGYLLWSQHCHGGKYPKYGYKDNYIWTTDCCLILARICYQEKETPSEPSLPKLEMLMEDLKEEAVDSGQDQAGLNHTEIHQKRRAGMCKLLLPKSSIPVTQASIVNDDD